jgi:hypothetical protein
VNSIENFDGVENICCFVVLIFEFQVAPEGVPYICGVASICYGIDVVYKNIVGKLRG